MDLCDICKPSPPPTLMVLKTRPLMRAVLLALCGTLFAAFAADWQLVGPYGGSASVVVANPHAPGAFLAGSNNGLLFYTTNGGDAWTRLPFAAQLQGVLRALAIDPVHRDTFYAGVDGAEVSGLWRSQDAGLTWHRLPGLRAESVWSLEFMPAVSAEPSSNVSASPNTRGSRALLAGTGTGLFRSSDQGETWQRLSPESNLDLRPIVSIAVNPANPQQIFAGTTHLPWRTDDGGRTWRSIHTGMLDDSDVFSIRVDHTAAGHLFATACSGIYTSSSLGDRWQKLRGAPNASYRTYFIAQHPTRANLFLAGTTGGLVRSENRGQLWVRQLPSATRSIAFHPTQPDTILAATEGQGLQRSDDAGLTWRPVNDGFCNRAIPAIAATPTGLHVSSLEGKSSQALVLPIKAATRTWFGAQSAPLVALAAAPDGLLAASYSHLLLSRDGGKTFQPLAALPAGVLVEAMAVLPAAAPLSMSIKARVPNGALKPAASYQVWLATDAGLHHWMPSRPAIVRAPQPPLQRPLSGLAVLGENQLAVLQGEQAWLVATAPEGVANLQSLALPQPGIRIYGLAATGGHWAAATSHGLFLTSNQGLQWSLLPGPIRGTFSRIQADPRQAGRIYTNHFGDLFAVDLLSGQWQQLNQGRSSLSTVRSLLVPPGDSDRIFALTNRQGVFAIQLPKPSLAASAP